MRKAIIFIIILFPILGHASFVSKFLTEVESNMSYEEYHTAQRGYYSMGSAVIRVQRKTLNPINITPPSIDIGCGGIDIIGGSFNFAKGSEIIELFKGVSKQAPFLAVSLAMKHLCVSCADTVNEIMAYIQQLNNFQLDSCAIAEGSVQAVYDVGVAVKEGSVSELKDRAMNNMKKGIKGAFGKAVDEAKKDENRVQDINSLNFSGKDFLKNGGSLLDYVYKKWLSTGGSSSQFAFPNMIDISQVRALYGDVFYKNDKYMQVADCGKKFTDLYVLTPLKTDHVKDCSYSKESIEDDVNRLVSEIFEGYFNGTNVSDKALLLLYSLGNTNVGVILKKYSKAEDKDYLKSISPLTKKLAVYEITRLYYDSLYQELIPVLNSLSAEAGQNAESYAPMLQTQINELIKRIERNYTSLNDQYMLTVQPLLESFALYEQIRKFDPGYNTLIKTLEENK